MKRLVTGIVVLVLLSSWAGAQVTGWRGDGSGRYPDAEAPVTWGRWPKSPVRGLRWQTDRPAGAPGKDSRELDVTHLIREWLVIGPFPAAQDLLEHPYIPDEAKLSPGTGDKVGPLAWQVQPVDKTSHQGTEIPWINFNRVLGKNEKNEQVAYGHVYLHAETPGTVVLVTDHGRALRMWLNGEAVYTSVKPSLSLWAINNISWGQGNYYPTPFGVVAQRISVKLVKGWNRLLLKSTGVVHLRVTAEPDVAYDQKNIVWVSRLPDGSNADPVIVGDRIFLMAEPDELVCVDKRDGKILWRRSNSFFDATPEVDRAKHPDFAEVAKLTAERLAAETDADKIVLRKKIQDKLVAIDKDRYDMVIEGHATSHRPIAGWTTPTPVSDGRHVWVWVTNGVAACYDLEGNRRWIRRVDLDLKRPEDKHGPYRYPSSPALVAGKFIVSVSYPGTVALIADDGSLGWINRDVASGIALIAGKVAGTDVVFSSRGDVIRVADGKVLWLHDWRSLTVGSVFQDNRLYLMVLGMRVIDFSRVDPADLKPVVTSIDVPGYTGFASPLVHEGLVYLMDRFGTLHVLDVEKRSVAYTQKLDMSPLDHYNACGSASSPTLAGKYIHVIDNQGTSIVFRPGRTFQQVAKNEIRTLIDRPFPLTPQETTTYSNPVFEGSRMYLRGERYLYCIGR
ncbi:MAG TPA: PQQ-binding-like beta-propeller repeat protein [Planctomycetota bacterium]|nr:PQQ-binding-like beta-propeller repeat protein [Planctomycetota bacterium]